VAAPGRVKLDQPDVLRVVAWKASLAKRSHRRVAVVQVLRLALRLLLLPRALLLLKAATERVSAPKVELVVKAAASAKAAKAATRKAATAAAAAILLQPLLAVLRPAGRVRGRGRGRWQCIERAACRTPRGGPERA
jgi:hypothetical protein